MKKLIALGAIMVIVLYSFGQETSNAVPFDSSKFTFIEDTKAFGSIEDILKLHQFKNKVVYIDLWGYGCAACMREFKSLPALKNKYKNKEVAYLYIFYKHADCLSAEIKETYWRKYAVDNGLTGTHVLAYVQPPQTINNEHILPMRERKTITLDKDIYAIPRYMIADRNGKIQVFDAPRPQEKTKPFATIDKLLKG
jgi:thiol-disulfide isomerase/thioredoxin